MTTYGGVVTRDAEGRWTAYGRVTHPDGTHTRTTTDGTTSAEVWAGMAKDLRAIATSTSTTRTTPR